MLQADRPAELINAWTADTKNSTRRDWRWAKLNNDYVEWPTGHNSTGLNDQARVKLFKGFRSFKVSCYNSKKLDARNLALVVRYASN